MNISTQSISVLIVEDEAVIAENIRMTLEQMGYNCLEPALHYYSAMAAIEHYNPDLVLLDINLGEDKDGIDIGKALDDKHNVPFIFITANTDDATMKRAMKVRPYAYVPKPFTRQALFAAVQLALNNFQNNQKATEIPKTTSDLGDIVYVKSGNKFIRILWEEVHYINSAGKYSILNTASDMRYPVRNSMDNISLYLISKGFLRIHKSYLVNKRFITSFTHDTVHINDAALPIGSTYKADFLKSLNIMS